MPSDPLTTIEAADIGALPEGVVEVVSPSLNLDKLPDGVVSGTEQPLCIGGL